MFENIKNKIEDNKRSKNGLEVLDKDLVKFLGEKHKDNLEKYETARGELIKYFDDLELRPELLQDKVALDLGSNEHFFDEYCKEKYNTSFVALDKREWALGTKHDMGVLADARSLPFKNDAFDLVISHASMPHLFAPTTDLDGKLILIESEVKEKALEDILSVFRESYRVIKTQGQIRMDTLGEKAITLELKKLLHENPSFITSPVFDQQISRIKLIKEALGIFEKESGARCIFKDEEKGGLIIILK